MKQATFNIRYVVTVHLHTWAGGMETKTSYCRNLLDAEAFVVKSLPPLGSNGPALFNLGDTSRYRAGKRCFPKNQAVCRARYSITREIS